MDIKKTEQDEPKKKVSKVVKKEPVIVNNSNIKPSVIVNKKDEINV